MYMYFFLFLSLSLSLSLSSFFFFFFFSFFFLRKHLDGAIVVLSEEGQLEACYLGSEPSLFIAPPLHRRGYDYVAAEDELMELRKLAKKHKTSGMNKYIYQHACSR